MVLGGLGCVLGKHPDVDPVCCLGVPPSTIRDGVLGWLPGYPSLVQFYRVRTQPSSSAEPGLLCRTSFSGLLRQFGIQPLEVGLSTSGLVKILSPEEIRMELKQHHY